MIRRFALRFTTMALAVCLLAPSLAYADDALGDVDAPATPTAATATASSTTTSGDALDTSAVTLSADNLAARLDGCAFALDDFSRAQVGSNRDVEGTYSGYCYYVGSSAGSVSMVATEAYAVVYVPATTAQQLGFSASDASSCEQLKQQLVALDTANAHGGATLAAQTTWYFTTEAALEVDGVRFEFDRELSAGRFYDSVLGVDGSDVTEASNPHAVELTHASFATMVPADDAAIVAQPGIFESMTAFLGGIDYSPLWVTLRTTGIAIVFIFLLGLAAAYFSLRIPKRAQDIADTLFTIPMVLPPTVCGFLLLLAFGRNTALGQWFIDIGFPLIFSWQATVIAAVVVAFPLMYRSARGAFENLDSNMLDAARTLGWSNGKIFFRLMLPLSWSSIAAGTVLSFARALGEFGATLFLAGNYAGITRTIPIAIYFEWMNGNTDVAIFWTIVIMIFSFIVILFINLWSRRTTKYRRRAES